MKRLEDIGFYTLSDDRARNTSERSPLWRCELVLTETCNFKCPYCRGILNDHARGTISLKTARKIVSFWIKEGLQNVRFTGGEPTLYSGLTGLVGMCKNANVKHIAISTNGSNTKRKYQELLDAGVNDVSISLDACCATVGQKMSGGVDMWDHVIDNIKWLSERAYVTLGMVFTEDTIGDCVNSVLFADTLGASDIRVIPSAQFNAALTRLQTLPDHVLDKYPILRYRIGNVNDGRHVRGLRETDCQRCWLALDDMACAQGKHFPCIIHLREGGDPIGEINKHTRYARLKWAENHNTWDDPICRKNCLDVCIDYNNKVKMYRQ